MKKAYLLILFLVSFIFLVCQSLANHVIARVDNFADLSKLQTDYTFIVGFERAGLSPFVRFEVDDQPNFIIVEELMKDNRIIWAIDEEKFNIHRRRRSHGSSVAAIFDRSAIFDENTDVWDQINSRAQPQASSNAIIGIVDTGVSRFQPGLLANVIAGKSFIQNSRTIYDVPAGIDTNSNGVYDEAVGHGTMVSGVILQIAPNTPLVIAKSADSDGIATSWSVIQGVVYCVENRAKVINISLGSIEPMAGFSEFLNWVEESGCVIVAPIGNNGANMSLYPANYPSVICVAGLMPNNVKAPFSNWNFNAMVAVPATGVTSTWYDGATASFSGTSLSAPIVSGCLALALGFNPDMKPEAIRRALLSSGRDIDGLNPLYRGQIGKLLDLDSLIFALSK